VSSVGFYSSLGEEGRANDFVPYSPLVRRGGRVTSAACSVVGSARAALAPLSVGSGEGPSRPPPLGATVPFTPLVVFILKNFLCCNPCLEMLRSLS
jgi:hypothetical protein